MSRKHAQYVVTHKPVLTARCGPQCRGVLMRLTLSRLEEGLGHEGFKCDECDRRVKYVPKYVPDAAG